MTKPFISTRTFTGLREGLDRHLGDSGLSAALSEADLPVSALETRRAYVPQLSQLDFFQSAARRCGAKNLVFAIGTWARVQNYGPFGDLVATPDRFGDALRLTRDLMPFHASHDRLSISRTDRHVRFRYHSALRNAPGYPHYAALAATVMLTIAKPYAATGHLRSVEFDFPAPRHTSPYLDYFGCEVRFDCETLALVFDPDAPKLRRTAPLHRPVTLQDVARDAFGGAPQTTLSAVEALVRASLGGDTGIRDVARRLDLSERTLRRRLDADGTRFRDVQLRIRLQTATELLLGTRLDIADVAQRVGYSHPSHLGYALRRATGYSPGDLRAGARANAMAGNRYRV